jgi:hypothetical protein
MADTSEIEPTETSPAERDAVLDVLLKERASWYRLDGEPLRRGDIDVVQVKMNDLPRVYVCTPRDLRNGKPSVMEVGGSNSGVRSLSAPFQYKDQVAYLSVCFQHMIPSKVCGGFEPHSYDFLGNHADIALPDMVKAVSPSEFAEAIGGRKIYAVVLTCCFAQEKIVLRAADPCPVTVLTKPIPGIDNQANSQPSVIYARPR